MQVGEAGHYMCILILPIAGKRKSPGALRERGRDITSFWRVQSPSAAGLEATRRKWTFCEELGVLAFASHHDFRRLSGVHVHDLAVEVNFISHRNVVHGNQSVAEFDAGLGSADDCDTLVIIGRLSFGCGMPRRSKSLGGISEDVLISNRSPSHASPRHLS